jgi:hypothetical protein
MADTKPVIRRQTNTAAICGVAAIGMLETLKRKAEVIHNFFLPKFSVKGDRIR